jgi:Lon protease-like protein
MFPLERAMLPGEELPLRIFEPRYSAMISDCLAMDDPAFGVVLIAAGREVGGGDPYPRAAVEMWPDEPGEPVGPDAIRDVEDRMIALFERIASARGAEVSGRDIVAGADAAPDAAMWLYALTTRLPMGQADRYSVLAAPTSAARVAALNDAVETVSALVEFQLSGE